MNRILLAAASLFLSLTYCVGDAGSEAAQPNILLILSDDHSVPHLGCYGSPNVVTPNLDRFAAQGMVFNRAYTTAPQCAPSRASIFSGQSPVKLGVTRFTQPSPASTVFFTDVLREHGYFTGVAGRWHHLGGKKKEQPEIRKALDDAGLRYADERFDFVDVSSTKGQLLAEVPKTFGRFLDEVPAESPFFLYLGFSQTHRAWNSRSEGLEIDPASLVLPKDFPDLPEVRADYANFIHSLHELDRGFGQVMKVLDERGIANNTIVAFMGDNGEALLRGKGSLYDRGCHVPLLVRWPEVTPSGSTCDALVSGQDLGATFLQAVGMTVPKEMDSVSFLPALRGGKFEGRKRLFLERGQHGSNLPGRSSDFDLSRAVVTRDHLFIYNCLIHLSYFPVDMDSKPAWRAIENAHADGRLSALHERLYFQNPRPMFELYDLRNDVVQLNNLATSPSHKELLEQSRLELAKWMVRESDYLPLPTAGSKSK